jgi:hypothetical protein
MIVAALAAVATLPATASATDRYVDAETGVDAGTACADVAPCHTIGYAISQSGAEDVIFVDNGTYGETVTLGDGRSLVMLNFVSADGNGPAILDGGASQAVIVPPSGAGTIRGMTIRSNAISQVFLIGFAEVASNVFDDPDAANSIGVFVSGGPGSNIHDNTFVDPAPGDTRARAAVFDSSTPVLIRDNTIQNQNVGIQVGLVGAGETTVSGNEITGTHEEPFAGVAIATSPSGGGTIVLRANEISDAADAATDGILAGTGTTLIRNEVTGHDLGVSVATDKTGVTLFGDRLWDNNVGLDVHDTGVGAPQASASATNVTAVDNGADVSVFNGSLTLDSSIVESLLFSGSSTCTITFSRANFTGTDPSGCNAFQTTAAPLFVDAANGDFHLSAASTMIDAGNPADPGVGEVDFDGDPRAVDATPACTGNVDRRDIGADEYAPPPIDCTPPETTIQTGPANGEATNEPTVTFTFTSDDPGATFECNVDDAGFGACSQPKQHVMGPLADGEHSFAVRAVDQADNADPSPAARTFTVDTIAPNTRFTAKPPRRSDRRRFRFAFNAGEEATFECRLDSKPAFACDSPTRVRAKPGRHVFKVTATDVAGNEEQDPAAFRFRRTRR